MNIDPLGREIARLGLDVSSLAPLAQDESILTLNVPGGEASVDAWQRLRAALDRTGRWPIVCGDAGERRWADQFTIHTASPAKLLEDVPAGNPLEAMAAEELEADVEEESEEETDNDEEAQWPDTPPRLPFVLTSAFDVVEQTPLDRCLIALLPSLQPADAPAYMRFGGWNACPSPSMHVAFLRDWGRRFAAVPAAMTNDVIECHVASPPQTPDDARALAREQVRYCGDIVWQGTQSVERLAIELWQSSHWYFWWD